MAAQSVTKYKLNYFPITALGEPIRTAFTLAGIPFEDDRVPGVRWGSELKPSLPPHSQMPILHCSGSSNGEPAMMFQSRAILRYVGSIGCFQGQKLYPDDPLTRFKVDEVIEMVEDIRLHMMSTFSISDQAEKEKARAALVEKDTGKMWPGLVKLNKRLAESTFCAGDFVTIADCYVVSIIFMFQQPTFLDGFPTDSLKEFPNITALKDRFCGLAPIKELYKDEDPTGCRGAFRI